MPDKFYSQDRLWVEISEDGLAQIGLTAEAQAALGEISAAVPAEPGKNLAKGEACATLQTAQGEHVINAPLSGTIAEPNPALAENVAALNQNPDATWLFKMRLTDPTAFAQLLDRAAYDAMS